MKIVVLCTFSLLSAATPVNSDAIDKRFGNIDSVQTAKEYFQHPEIAASLGMEPFQVVGEVTEVLGLQNWTDVEPRIVTWAKVCREYEGMNSADIAVESTEQDYKSQVLNHARLNVFLPVPAIKVTFPSGDERVFEREGDGPKKFYERINAQLIFNE